MGVPLLLTWLRKRFALCFSPARGDMTGGGPRHADNVYIDLNALLYQSATIIAARKGRFASTYDVEDAVLRKLFELLDDILFNLTAPQALVYIAVDGVSPLGKMAQQRARRRRQSMRRPRPQHSGYNSNSNYPCDRNDRTGGSNSRYSNDDYMDEGNMDKLWDGNCISVGTRFMSKVTAALHVYAASRTERMNVHRFNEASTSSTAALLQHKSTLHTSTSTTASNTLSNVADDGNNASESIGKSCNNDTNTNDSSNNELKQDTGHSSAAGTEQNKSAEYGQTHTSTGRSSHVFRPVAFVIDDVLRPGEGENKIAEAIRRFHAQPGYNPNTSHIICSSDTDVTVSSLILHEPRMHVLRYEPSPLVGGKPEEARHDYRNRRHVPATSTLIDTWQSTFFSIHLFRERLREILGLAHRSSNTNNSSANSSNNIGNSTVISGCDVASDDSLRFERSLHDVVFVMLLFGNDFLPALGGSIQEGTLDALLNVIATDFVSRRASIVDPLTSQIRVENARYLMDCLADIRGIGTGGSSSSMHGGVRHGLRGVQTSDENNNHSTSNNNYNNGHNSKGDVLHIHGMQSRLNHSSNNNGSSLNDVHSDVGKSEDNDGAGEWGFDADAHFQARQQQRAKEAEQKCYCYWTMLQWALQYSAGVVEHWGCYYPYTTAPPLSLLRRYCGVMSYEGLVRFAATRHAAAKPSAAATDAKSQMNDVTEASSTKRDYGNDHKQDVNGTSYTNERGMNEGTVTAGPSSSKSSGNNISARRLGQPTDVMVQLLILMPTESMTLLPHLLQQHYSEIAAAVQAPIEQIDFDVIGSWCEALRARLSVEDRTRFDAYRLFALDEPLTQAVRRMYGSSRNNTTQKALQESARQEDRNGQPESTGLPTASIAHRDSRTTNNSHGDCVIDHANEAGHWPLANNITFMAYWAVDSCEAELAHVHRVRHAKAEQLLHKRQQSSRLAAARTITASSAAAISFFTRPLTAASDNAPSATSLSSRPTMSLRDGLAAVGSSSPSASAALAALRSTPPIASGPLVSETQTKTASNTGSGGDIYSGAVHESNSETHAGDEKSASAAVPSHVGMAASAQISSTSTTHTEHGSGSSRIGDEGAVGSLTEEPKGDDSCNSREHDTNTQQVTSLSEVCGCYVLSTAACDRLGEEKLIQSTGVVVGAQFTVSYVVGTSHTLSNNSNNGSNYTDATRSNTNHGSSDRSSSSAAAAALGSYGALSGHISGADSSGAALWSAALSRDSLTRRVRLHWVLAAVPEVSSTRYMDCLLPGLEPNYERSYQETTAAVLEEQKRRQHGGSVEFRQDAKRVRTG